MAGTLFENNLSPYLTIVETASGSVASPSAGQQRVAIDPTSHLLYWKDSAAAIHTAVANPMSAANDLIIGGASGAPTRLATSASKVLSTDGSGVISWATAGGGFSPANGRVSRTAGNLTTASTTLVDATGMSVTITTGAHAVLVSVTGFGSNDTIAQDVILDIDIDGAAQGGTAGLIASGGAAGHDRNLSFSWLSAALTAASHTIKLRWRVSGGNGTIFASGTAPLVFGVIEQNF